MNASVLLIDNIDSFTFNLVQALRQLGAEVCVRRSDEISVAEALEIDPTHLLIGPGPGHPKAAANCLLIARAFLGRCPVLGVCLGHQMLGLIGGAEVIQAQAPAHGTTQRIYHDGRPPFRGLPNPLEGARYHSLVVDEASLGAEYEVSAWSSGGEILGLRHRTLPVHGFQFHPESILTQAGERLLKGFLELRPVPAGAQGAGV